VRDRRVEIMAALSEACLQTRHIENARLTFTGAYVALSAAIVNHGVVDGMPDTTMLCLLAALVAIVGACLAHKNAVDLDKFMLGIREAVFTLDLGDYLVVLHDDKDITRSWPWRVPAVTLKDSKPGPTASGAIAVPPAGTERPPHWTPVRVRQLFIWFFVGCFFLWTTLVVLNERLRP
jgi:hypothetical protein